MNDLDPVGSFPSEYVEQITIFCILSCPILFVRHKIKIPEKTDSLIFNKSTEAIRKLRKFSCLTYPLLFAVPLNLGKLLYGDLDRSLVCCHHGEIS